MAGDAVELLSPTIVDDRSDPEGLLDENEEAEIAAVASIAEPHRRELYRLVVASEEPVGKDEAAAALGLSRSVAAFHLDRLVADGLLVATYRRRSGRQGPGAGRPAKLYQRAPREVAVSLPRRQYGLAADLLATAVEQATAGEVPVDRALTKAARAAGRAMARVPASEARDLDDLLEVLEQQGYEPRIRDDDVVLVNCPFHALVDQHRDLVCTMNLELLTGLAEGRPVRARLQPEDGLCCVRLRARPG